jgi:acetyl-CoA carboxylase biotin carboxyl carrier protein
MAGVIKSHITGNVWKIDVKVGDRVEEGTVVTIIENMKMEMPVVAEEAGTITAVLITENQAVREGSVLFEYE